jgi:K+/H+ antiporter YhaU regulatory subunit KhtT
MLFNPPSQTIIEANDIVVAMGSRAQLAALALLANPKT